MCYSNVNEERKQSSQWELTRGYLSSTSANVERQLHKPNDWQREQELKSCETLMHLCITVHFKLYPAPSHKFASFKGLASLVINSVKENNSSWKTRFA
eukprot:c19261_g1_i2 orf=649-942(-)